ncbi:MAG: fatty acid desaturase [bacterium]
MQAGQSGNDKRDRYLRPTRVVARFQKADRARAIWQLVNSYLPYLALVVAMYYTLQVSFWLTLPLTILAAGFLIRIFIIFHDCGHGSFFKSQRANRFWGRLGGLLSFTPYYAWTKNHKDHHLTSGNLDERGVGDVTTMTVKEYLAASRKERFKYRFYRHPLAMLLLGPLLIMLIGNRFLLLTSDAKNRLSIWGTNLGIVAIFVAVSLTVGIKYYLLIQIPIVYFALMFGIWLFYVQHQFEGVYWKRSDEWDFVEASLAGSSFYKLPKVLQWFSGSIGFHHVHHLNERVPNYRLEKCHKELAKLHEVPIINFRRSLKSLGYRLWDEEQGKLIGFGELRRLSRQSA